MAKMAKKKAKKPPRAKNPSAKISKARTKLGTAKGPADAWGRRGTDPVRVADILKKLDEAYPAVACALEHETPFQLLISTILSAQCTDVRVNQVTKTLYKKYPKPEAFAYANPSELEQDIRPTGFFRNKTKSIMGASKKIVEEFSGAVPHTMAELLTLPGVARKTANVVLGTAFEIADGVVVDTHVTRLSGRLDLSHGTDAKKIEQDLMAVIPKEKWIIFAHQLIWHGRRVCQARKPRCADCNLERLCYSQDKTSSTIPGIGSKPRSNTGSKSASKTSSNTGSKQRPS
jgi:endonuclease III